MATKGKLEARITIPTGGWSLSVTETGGAVSADSATVAAGTYYLSGAAGLVAALEAALNAATLDGTYTVALAAGEGGSGRVTISATGITSFALSWTDAELRDLLGFAGDETGTLSYSGTYQARHLWLPDCPPQTLNGTPHRGTWEVEHYSRESPSGYVQHVMGGKKRVLDLRFAAISRSKTWRANESTQNASHELFVADAIWGEAAWGTPGGPVRWHPDADDDDEFGTYSIPNVQRWGPESVRQHSALFWSIVLPRMVQIPSEAVLGLPLALNVAPTASFTSSETDLEVDFTDTSTDGDGTISSWAWDFGDGNTSTSQNPTHTYASAGTYTVTLTVTDSDGATDQASADVTVTSAARATIGVSLLTSGSDGTDGTSVATSSVTPASDAAIYACVSAGLAGGVTSTAPTCSGNGLTWELVDSTICGGASGDQVKLFVFRALGAAPTAGAITFDFGAETIESFSWYIVQCTNVDTSGTNGSGATVQAVTGAATANPVTTTLSALENAANVHLAFSAERGTATGWTPDADFVELDEESISGMNQGSCAQWATNQATCSTTAPAAANGVGQVSIEVKSGAA